MYILKTTKSSLWILCFAQGKFSILLNDFTITFFYFIWLSSWKRPSEENKGENYYNLSWFHSLDLVNSWNLWEMIDILCGRHCRDATELQNEEKTHLSRDEISEFQRNLLSWESHTLFYMLLLGMKGLLCRRHTLHGKNALFSMPRPKCGVPKVYSSSIYVDKVFAKTTNIMRLLYNWCIQVDMASAYETQDARSTFYSSISEQFKHIAAGIGGTDATKVEYCVWTLYHIKAKSSKAID